MTTPAEFFEKVVFFGRTGPDGKKICPTVSPKGDKTYFLMWMVYFQKIGLQASFIEMAKRFDTFQSWTVPTEDPSDFDNTVPVSLGEIQALQRRLETKPSASEAKRKKTVNDALTAFHSSRLPKREAAE
jgi:hypothetical protein